MKKIKHFVATHYPSLFKSLAFIYHAKIVKFFWQIFNNPKGILVYVGLNVGESFSRIYYRYEYSYGYEPNPINFKKVKNKLKNEKNIRLFNYAASSNGL